MTVIERVKQKCKHGDSAKWICQCDCGEICIKSSGALNGNNKISCGHLRSEANKKRMIDLTGRRFSKLVVLQYLYSQNKRTMWKCKCDCGKEIIVKGKYLLNGDTKSCGCFKRQNTSKIKKKPILPGTVFGKLIVLYELEERRKKSIYYHCKCECGNELDVQKGHLTRGDTRSCGCVNSFPEIQIDDFLRKNNINFKRQFKIDNCCSRKNRKLPFDFAVFDENNNLKCLLEFQGEQHFKNTFRSSEEKYREYIQHDKVKKDYCAKNNIVLHEIIYKEDVDKRLKQIFIGESK